MSFNYCYYICFFYIIGFMFINFFFFLFNIFFFFSYFFFLSFFFLFFFYFLFFFLFLFFYFFNCFISIEKITRTNFSCIVKFLTIKIIFTIRTFRFNFFIKIFIINCIRRFSNNISIF